MDIQELRKIGREKLIEENIEDAEIKADILLQYILKMDKVNILLNYENSVSKELEDEFFRYIHDVIKGKPVQYITNSQNFMNLSLYVDENVLIPQPDTEILVEEAAKKIYEISDECNKKNIKILDLCTGSGAIAIGIDMYIKSQSRGINLEIFATDISKKAIEIANKNAKTYNVNINFIEADMFNNINEYNFDLIVSNPPYIEKETISKLSNEVQNEPHIALDGGIDGLDFYRIISNEGYKYLNSNGWILVEIGYDQKEKVINLFSEKKKYFKIDCVKDLNLNDRVVEAKIYNK